MVSGQFAKLHVRGDFTDLMDRAPGTAGFNHLSRGTALDRNRGPLVFRPAHHQMSHSVEEHSADHIGKGVDER